MSKTHKREGILPWLISHNHFAIHWAVYNEVLYSRNTQRHYSTNSSSSLLGTRLTGNGTNSLNNRCAECLGISMVHINSTTLLIQQCIRQAGSSYVPIPTGASASEPELCPLKLE